MLITDFTKRRRKLLQSMAKNSVAVLPSHPVHLRNNDVEFAYRADSDLYYLTGFTEPDSVMLLVKSPQGSRFILFNRPRDPLMETWHGRRAGQIGAVRDFAADEAFPVGELDQRMPGFLQNCANIYYSVGQNMDFDQRMMRWIKDLRSKGRAGTTVPSDIIRLDQFIHAMRLRKDRYEIQHMRMAAKISADAHIRAMRMCRPGLYEYQIEAELQHEMLSHGCPRLAYTPIVASGENTCILHYTENNARLNDGDLMLIDAGGEYEYYAADITRTFPVNGRFSQTQAAIYRIVLRAQYAAIAQIKPGRRWNEPHDAAVRALTEGLIKLGILKGNPAQLIKHEAYKKFYMHRTGHWLGMDVHDVGEYKQNGLWRKFEEGMVLTVEPGLYFAPGAKGVAKKWWKIGVRIEDDVLVTRDGCEVLTRHAPKEIDAIERLMAAP